MSRGNLLGDGVVRRGNEDVGLSVRADRDDDASGSGVVRDGGLSKLRNEARIEKSAKVDRENSEGRTSRKLLGRRSIPRIGE